VAVVDDENALLGLAWDDLDRCGTQDLVTISNRLGSPLSDVDVYVVSADRLETDISSVPDGLDPGESGTVRIRLQPENANQTDDRSVTVGVEASGSGVGVKVYERVRTVTNCPTRNSPGGGSGQRETNG
jgi:hypothetical protein